MQTQTVINKIGGGRVRETARRLKVPIGTFYRWVQSGKVPHWREVHVRAVAQAMGVNVDIVEREGT